MEVSGLNVESVWESGTETRVVLVPAGDRLQFVLVEVTLDEQEEIGIAVDDQVGGSGDFIIEASVQADHTATTTEALDDSSIDDSAVFNGIWLSSRCQRVWSEDGLKVARRSAVLTAYRSGGIGRVGARIRGGDAGVGQGAKARGKALQFIEVFAVGRAIRVFIGSKENELFNVGAPADCAISFTRFTSLDHVGTTVGKCHTDSFKTSFLAVLLASDVEEGITDLLAVTREG